MTVSSNCLEFSVILPSFNGADTLPECLDALRMLTPPEGGVEFIFIDNRSTDETAALLSEAARQFEGVFLEEARPGKSHALNSAIARARGEFLVFTDDDTLADKGWLQAYEKAVEAYPDVSVFAGQIRPEWKSSVPEWINELAQRGQIAGCTPADHPEGPFPAFWVKGANMVVRRSLLAAQAFDTESVNFGAASTAVGGEDSKLMHDFEAAGENILHVPDASLRHIVLPHEATPGFVLSRQVRIGRGNAITEGVSLLSAVRKLADIIAYALIAPMLFVLGRNASAFQQLMKISRRLGMLQMWARGRL